MNPKCAPVGGEPPKANNCFPARHNCAKHIALYCNFFSLPKSRNTEIQKYYLVRGNLYCKIQIASNICGQGAVYYLL